MSYSKPLEPMTVQPRTRHLPKQRCAGGATFLVGSAVVHLGNYLFNVVMGRALGPALFSDLAVIVTLLLVVTLAAGSLQTAAAKAATEPGGEAVQAWLRRRAVAGGVAVAGVMALGSPTLATFFNASSAWPFTIFGLGVPALFAQAVDRGFLQGGARFGRLAFSYQTEMWMRLGGAVLLVWAGLGLNGAVTALSLSFVASWMAARPRSAGAAVAPTRPRVGAVFGAAAVLALGEVLVNHVDLLVVKHFSEPVVAGAYGAIAVVGRVPFFVAWSLAAVAFPFVASGSSTARRRCVAAVAVAGVAVTAVSWAIPDVIIGMLFGADFAAFAHLLGPYALATSLLALARTVGFLELAAGRHIGATLVLGAGVFQAAALWMFHGAIGTVVIVRLVTMVVLLAAVLVWSRFSRKRRR
jgi:O-antigen/teichoic acid export membrane protein